jgi:uncharacterized protein
VGHKRISAASPSHRLESADVYRSWTFIIAFSVAKKHLAVTPEKAGIDHFEDELKGAGYAYTSMIIRFPWDKPFDFNLLAKMIEFNLEDKKDCLTFWRKQ